MKNILRISGVIIILLFHSCKEKPTPPVLTTADVSAISYTTATSGGEVTNEGGDPVISRGICWNTSADPTTSNNKTSESGGLGTFTSNITSLTPNTTYYIRAYATNSAGTSYGNEISFKTLQVEVPVLTTAVVTSITSISAVAGGIITDDKGGNVNVRGVCWSKTTNPTITNDKTTDGTGSGSFVSNITGLQPGTIYYISSYASNSVGTQYGNQLSFKTRDSIPTVTTTSISGVTEFIATSGGNVISDGGAPITVRGVCWSTSENPTFDKNSRTSDGIGIGVFISTINGLTPNTTYHFRAYATNSFGTGYGSSMTYTTQPGVILFNPNLMYGTLTDIDGNIYKTIQIGTQTWMAENLKTARYNDGIAVLKITENTAWALNTTGAYRDYDNSTSNSDLYGRLYNWYAVDNNIDTKIVSNGGRNVCPSGWHVPSDLEWKTLEMFLGMTQAEADAINWRGSDQGAKLKSTSGWNTGESGTNTSGFTAVPSGNYSIAVGGNFVNVGNFINFWSSTATYTAWTRALRYNGSNIRRSSEDKKYGFSVRCIKD